MQIHISEISVKKLLFQSSPLVKDRGQVMRDIAILLSIADMNKYPETEGCGRFGIRIVIFL